MPTKLILDVDTGTDDAVAIMLAALHPDLDLVGVTTVTGNALVDVTTENTLRVLDHIGVAVPVFCGSVKPLARDDLPVPRATPPPGKTYAHGTYLELPEARSAPQARRAVEFLIDTFADGATETVLVATGPLTNVALALRAEPRLADWIPRTVIMGGAHRTGNITPRAEFNMWADPEAARVVLGAGLRNVTLVTLDATHQALVSANDAAAFRDLGTPAGVAMAGLTERRIAGYDARLGNQARHAAPIHDALCVAALIRPDIISCVDLFVDVETNGALTTGETVIDVDHRLKHAANASVAFGANASLFISLLLGAFAGA
ncbi:MAG: nucleoside hydrolase [Bifidobacteriaceae bacterium]|jgi:purine nucleosidase/ribosylpyrimidine nucleosidase|nr:nucleoside hydrolase [Bifidobacteriaceae bacterium]